MYDSRVSSQYTLNLIGVLAAFTAMNYARPVLVPLFLACFLAITIQPALQWLNKFIPRWVSAIVVTLILLVVIVGGSSIFVADIVGVADRSPAYAARFREMIQGITDFAAGYGVEANLADFGSGEGLSWVFGFLTDGLQSVMGVLAETVLVLFMMVFLLMEGGEFRKKIARSFTNSTSELLLDSIDSIVTRIQTYMVTKTLVSLVSGVTTTLFTWMLGLEFPILWGVMTFLLNFIPNIGSIIAVVPPVLVAFLQFETLTPGLIALVVLSVVDMVMGNVVEPRVMARSLDLSTLVVFVSMIFWGWLWGRVGVVLAVPLTAAIKIICEHVEGLHAIAILLGERAESVPRDIPLSTVAVVGSPSVARLEVVTPRRSITLVSALAGPSPAQPSPTPGQDPRVLRRLFDLSAPVPKTEAPAASLPAE